MFGTSCALSEFMIDAVTVTLIILVAALLRRPLLTDPDAAGGVREDEGAYGSSALVPVPVRANSPHPARMGRTREKA